MQEKMEASQTKTRQPASKLVIELVSLVWFLLLYPWTIVAPLSSLAFVGHHKALAYVSVWSAWAYPIVVMVGVFFRRKHPGFVLLPLINVVGFSLVYIAERFTSGTCC